MDSYNLLAFNSALGKRKFEYTKNLEDICPFCNRDNLEEILAEDGSIILVKNKFQVLEDAFQTVLIETDNCTDEFSTYPKEYLYQLLRFGVKQWLQMEQTGEYSSVLFFKNHGPLSGGSLPHAHMQIIGLKNIDYRSSILPEFFEGLLISRTDNVEFNISTSPKIGFSEFNIILNDLDQINQMADKIQLTVHYLLNHFRNCNSYNLFFYHIDQHIYAKIIPRFITSPLFVGYSLAQVSDRIKDIAHEIKKLYIIR
ncbi:MAG: DUF4931 domain-containing protein [Firmicutes bacterium HGW-Firmicutes-12]|jgi:galactose-1-phosphate uridylyltransferase|nr:MAG: DUF4931 domain-containing protein [Firmicutes bacterium HGW-Firmicutes-12]